MDSNCTADPGAASAQVTKQNTGNPPNFLPVGTASFFNNAQNNHFTGSSFTITTGTVNGLNVLHKRAAPNAILNAGGRADEVRCHPGTRKEVIDRIEKWGDAENDLVAPVFWLSGPAGAGKTAIVQTITERCDQRGAPQANFFFFRGDSSRSNAFPLVATLLHQIIQLYPSLRDPISTVLSGNPLIFESILEKQLVQLIVEPLRAMQQSSSSYRPVLLLIDGLDECDSDNKHIQQQIVRAFDKVLSEHPCLFRLLVASRNESQITTAFNEISSQLLPLYLDDEYSPESDIRLYVNDQFKRVLKTHPLARTLDLSWPSSKDVDGIVEKSSGAFIYAASVMRFIVSSSSSPMISLERVQGAAEITAKSPFSHLDAVYAYILCQVDDQEGLKDILHAQRFLDSRHHKMGVAEYLQLCTSKYPDAHVRSCVGDLTSIARYTENGALVFHHASLSDYLLDKSRSGDYFVDLDAFNSKILSSVWKGIGKPYPIKIIALTTLLRVKKLPPDFLNTLLVLEPSKFRAMTFHPLVRAFKHIYNALTCDDDFIIYKQIMHRWINMLSDDDIHKIVEGGGPPCTRRYSNMACIERNLAIEPTGDTAIALRPETNFDTLETASWLGDILHRMHREYYPHKIQDYQQLLKKWISWAVWNDIPLDGLNDIPDIRWYLWKTKTEKWAASYIQFGNGKS